MLAPSRSHAATAQPSSTSRSASAYSEKHALGLDPGVDTGFAIRIRARSRVHRINYGKAMELTFADETDDILCRAHGLSGDGTGAIGAVDQDRIDMAGVCHQPLHFGGDRRQFCDAEFHQ